MKPDYIHNPTSPCSCKVQLGSSSKPKEVKIIYCERHATDMADEIMRLQAQNAALLEALRGIHAISRLHKTPTEARVDRIMPMAEAAITAASD